MAKIEVIRAPQPPIEEVALRLTLEEAQWLDDLLYRHVDGDNPRFHFWAQ